MKTKDTFSIVLIALIVLVQTSCSPLILKANFDSDSAGYAPNPSPPGDPAGDEILYRIAGDGCHYTVENSAIFESKALKFNPISLGCIDKLMLFSKNVNPLDLNKLTYFFLMYTEHNTCRIVFNLKAKIGEPGPDPNPSLGRALSFQLSERGELILTDGTQRPRVIGTYDAYEKLIFLVVIDKVTNTFTLTLTRAGKPDIVERDRSLYSSDFWRHRQYGITFDHVGVCGGTLPANRAYYIDEIRLKAEEE